MRFFQSFFGIYVLLISIFLEKKTYGGLRFYDDFYGSINCSLGNARYVTLNYAQKYKDQEKDHFLISWPQKTDQKIPAYHKPALGGLIKIMRCLPPGRFVTVAKGQVTGLNGILVEAQVEAFDYKKSVYGKVFPEEVAMGAILPRPMVGDIVLTEETNISEKLQVNPTLTFFSKDIFKSNAANSYADELSEQGKEKIKQKIEAMRGLEGELVIEGFILEQGNRDELRKRSLLRAQTVAAFIAREYQLESRLVTAIGYGNDWYQKGMVVQSGLNKAVEDGVRLKLVTYRDLQ